MIRRLAFCALIVLAIDGGTALAQTRPAPRPLPPPADPFGFRGFADVGGTRFSASQSFEAVLGTATGMLFGGGAEALFSGRVFVNVRVSRFEHSGERVFVSGGTQFPLGIPSTVTITPIEVSAGYRVVRPRWRVVPYAGGGIGWYGYAETSEFATDEENVSERFTGYHVLGGVEFPLSRWIGIAGEAQWATVPDALGQDPNSVAREFGESNLGGTTFRVKLVIGR